MKKPVKPKSSVPTKKREADLEGFMVKIQDQLAALAKKMDAWISQIPAMPSHAPAHMAPLPSQAVSQKSFQQPSAAQSSHPSHPRTGPGEARRSRGRRERLLHKAVCADCHQDCEIPFKPSGERPVYCKPCFSKRKAANSPKVESVAVPSVSSVAQVPEKVDRRVVVTKKGVGKVTVSEIIRPAARPFPSRDRSQKPVQKAKK